jgi:Flp pilus assembly CpaF family ATPase
MANIGLPHRSTREAIALAIHLVVHVARVDGERRVTQLVAVNGYDTATDRFALQPLYTFAPTTHPLLIPIETTPIETGGVR